MSTVGYGDYYPVTVEGRLVAVGLMLAGVALLGVVTASIAAWLIETVREVETENQAATRTDLAQLHREPAELRSSCAGRPTRPASRPANPVSCRPRSAVARPQLARLHSTGSAEDGLIRA
jgi:hypothetical protein